MLDDPIPQLEQDPQIAPVPQRSALAQRGPIAQRRQRQQRRHRQPGAQPAPVAPAATAGGTPSLPANIISRWVGVDKRDLPKTGRPPAPDPGCTNCAALSWKRDA
jgi:hypothetical protein